MKLFRPVGLAELALIVDVEMRSFPPRLPEQPIFYPVLNEQYAAQIAREWNAPSDPGFAGYVTEFVFNQRHLRRAESQSAWRDKAGVDRTLTRDTALRFVKMRAGNR